MSKEKNSSNFLVQGSILAIASIVSRLIGLLYRIPMTNAIGSDGIGVYSTAYNVYFICLLLSSYSLPTAVSKLVSERMALHQYKNAQRILRVSMVFALIAGTAAAAVMFFGADFLAVKMQNMPEARIAIMTLAPTIFIMAFLGVLRGYFQGMGSMVPTAISQVLEQFLNAIVSVTAAISLFAYGRGLDELYSTSNQAVSWGAAGGTIGTGAGAFIAFVFCALLYLAYRRVIRKNVRRDRSKQLEGYPYLMKCLLVTAIPIILNTGVYNVSIIFDNSLFGHYTSSAGIYDQYKLLWGEFSGKYHLLTNVPISMSNALALSIVPALSRAVARRNFSEAADKTDTSIRFIMVVAVPCVVGLSVLAMPIMNMLFKSDNTLAAQMMTVGSFTIIFYSLSTVTNAILQGMNHMHVPVINALIALILHNICLVIFLWGFHWGIYGAVWGNISFGIFMCVLNFISLRRYLSFHINWKKTVILPVICSAVMGVITWLVYHFGFKAIGHNTLMTLFSMMIAVAVYGVMLLVTRCVEEAELYSFPKGALLVKIAKKLHLLK
ncbi:MAG: polysaccharide biosynthesis protein [Lachnospiraceae bacterium]|nr:polysaccharide biosynthesis protein [Lachnospiraceae bacterium]